jgi:hypothetical protein
MNYVHTTAALYVRINNTPSSLVRFKVKKSSTLEKKGLPQLIDQQYIDQQYIDRRYINQRYINRQYIDRQYIDRRYIDQLINQPTDK